MDSRRQDRHTLRFKFFGNLQTVHTRQRRDFDRAMPNTPTAKKRLRQNEKLRVHNKGFRSALRTQVKKVRTAVAAGNLDVATTEFRVATKKLDQAAAKHMIHRNAAARTKSRLSLLIKKASQPATA
jgi:small subunit ribosomal protein S20